MNTTPRAVRVNDWTWYHEDGSEEFCVVLNNRRHRIIIPARQLRQIADALHDRADQIDDEEYHHDDH